MCITRVSKAVAVGVIFALAAPSVHGQGSGGGGGGPPPDASTSSGADDAPDTASVTVTSAGSSSDSGTTRGPPESSSGGGGGGGGSGAGSSSSGGGAPPDSSSIEYTTKCDQEGYDASYNVSLSGAGELMVRQVSSDTGCANHVNYGVDKGPDYHFPGRYTPSNTSIPAYPQVFGNNGTTDLSTGAGQVAIMANGVALFSAWAREEVVDYATTAFALEGETFDACGSHSTEGGWYHYHNTPGCFQEQVMELEGLTYADHSPFLGWSYDGFPIYGHLGTDGVTMLSCGEVGADDTYCLDTCNGYEGELPDIDDFTYRYYLTCGYNESYFPLTINCFRGCCPDGMTCNELVEACDADAEAGYTDDYTPGLGLIVTEQYETSMLEGPDVDYINSTTSTECSLFYGVGTTPAPVLITSSTPTTVSSSSADTASPVSGTSSTTDDDDAEADETGTSGATGLAPPTATSFLAGATMAVAAAFILSP